MIYRIFLKYLVIYFTNIFSEFEFGAYIFNFLFNTLEKQALNIVECINIFLLAYYLLYPKKPLPLSGHTDIF